MSDYTDSNRVDLLPFTMTDVAACCRAFEALPPVENDITVAPDVFDALRTHLAANPGDYNLFNGERVHVDVTLSAATWHKGKPRSERATRGVENLRLISLVTRRML
jgi:hypothetical protein